MAQEGEFVGQELKAEWQLGSPRDARDAMHEDVVCWLRSRAVGQAMQAFKSLRPIGQRVRLQFRAVDRQKFSRSTAEDVLLRQYATMPYTKGELLLLWCQAWDSLFKRGVLSLT